MNDRHEQVMMSIIQHYMNGYQPRWPFERHTRQEEGIKIVFTNFNIPYPHIELRPGGVTFQVRMLTFHTIKFKFEVSDEH